MKQTTIKSMGLEIPVSVPETVEEFDNNAGRPGACLDEATNNVLYRSFLADFRSAFTEAVEKETQIERETETTTDKDGKEKTSYSETEAKYFNRVCAKLGVDSSHFTDLANKVAGEITFDASATVREPGQPKKLAALYLNAADKLIEAGKAEQAAAKLTELLKPSVPFEATRESLAAAISANEARKRRELAQKVANLEF